MSSHDEWGALMQMTRGGEYGLRGMLYLAQQGADTVSMVSAIADAQDIPAQFLAKIFQMLARAGLVKSRRGVKGGFSLMRPASEITVHDVIEAIDGPMRVHHDTAAPLRGVLEEARAQMTRVLSQANFGDLARAERRGAGAGASPGVGAAGHAPTPRRSFIEPSTPPAR